MGIFFILVYYFKALQKPGTIFGSFLLGYGLIRFFIEFVREPDSFFVTEKNPLGHIIQISTNLGFSMGQVLCVPMIIVGFWLIWKASGQNRECH